MVAAQVRVVGLARDAQLLVLLVQASEALVVGEEAAVRGASTQPCAPPVNERMLQRMVSSDAVVKMLSTSCVGVSGGGGGDGGGAVGGVGGVCRGGLGPLSLDGPADASCPDIWTDSDCVSASMMISSCMNRSWWAVYGHVHARALVLSSYGPPIAMVSAALARHCRRQYAMAL